MAHLDELLEKGKKKHFRMYSPGLGQIPCAQPWDHVGSVPIDLGGDDEEVS